MKFKGTVIKGFSVGQKFGIATANIEVQKKPKLKEGVYMVEVYLCEERTGIQEPGVGIKPQISEKDKKAGTLHARSDFKQGVHKGLMHFGKRQTFGGGFSIEVHLLNFEQNIYSKVLEIEILGFMRETKAFENADALYSQIEKDVVQARKYFLRQNMVSHWDQVTPAQEKIWSQTAVTHLLEDQDFLAAQRVFGYAPMVGKEIPFIRRLMELCPHKDYYFPHVRDRGIIFYRVKDFHHLRRGFKGILEPREEDPFHKSSLETDPALMLMPSVGIGHDHVRLGQGGGYYDRWMEPLEKTQRQNLKTIAVIPRFAYIKDMPSQDWDTRIDKIIVV